MHSVILSYVYMLFIKCRRALSGSSVWGLFCGIYDTVSQSFMKSSIANWVKGSDGDSEKNTVIYKICGIPFHLLELLSRRIGDWLKRTVEKSMIVNLCGEYFNSFIALNTRFFGAMAVAAGAGYFGINFVLGAISSKALILFVFGLILCLFNYNIMGFLNGSRIVFFFKGVAGFSEIDFNFYDESRIRSRVALILGALTGFLAGVAAVKTLALIAAIPLAVFSMLLIMYYPIAGVFMAAAAAPIVPTMALAGLCIFTTLSLVINKLMEPDYKWRLRGIGTALILLLGILLITSVLSFNPTKSLMVWMMYFVFFSFYFVVINTVNTKRQLISLLKIFVISGAFVALYGVIQYVFRIDTKNAWIDESMFEGATMRVYSTLENPNVLGEYLLLILPLSAVFMLKFKSRDWAKWIYGGIFLLSALCLVFTQSRGCWLGFILSFIVFITFYKGKLWLLVPFGIMLLPFVLPQSIVERLMSIGDMSDSSTSYRVYIWYGTLAMLKTYWIGGIGMGEGAFSRVYPFYSYNAVIAPHSHNLFLQLIVEAGVGALIVFGAVIVLFIKSGINVCRKYEKKSYEYITSLALISGVAGFMLQSMFDYTFYNYRVMSMFIMYLAFGATLKNMNKEEKC